MTVADFEEIFTFVPDFTVILQVAFFVDVLAVIVALPAAFAYTKPPDTVATDVFDDVHVTSALEVAII